MGSSGAADPAAVLKATPGGVPMGDVSSTLLWVLLQSFFSPMSLKLMGLAVPSLGKGGDNRSQLCGDVPTAWPRVTPLPGAGQCGCQMVHLGPGKTVDLAAVGGQQCCFGRTGAAVVPFGVQLVVLALLPRARHGRSAAQY